MLLFHKSGWFASSFIGWLLLAGLPTAIAKDVASPLFSVKTPALTATSIAKSGIARSGMIPVGQHLDVLQRSLTSLQRSRYAGLEAGIAIVDLDTGNYLSMNGDRVYPTASIIKLPILIALFQDVDAGKIRLTETLTMSRDLMVGGSGDMQYQRAGSQFSLLETATKMITISDNTATNMIIKRMGGIKALNDRFRQWGLQKTQMQNPLPDRFGTNVTTAAELVQLLAMLDRQQLLSAQSQAQVMAIMSQVRNRTLLPAGLGRGAAIAHKTGDIGFLQGDTGIIRMPSGKRYLAAILVKSDRNAPDPKDFIQEASRLVYSYLSQPMTTAQVK
ncbi:MAG: serine hydrolase [Leptolyngbyaceae cyanobacterium bins.302]|nr:serine hydrolase [Leptolyngbyaceae cyanobacterium bins.302]